MKTNFHAHTYYCRHSSNDAESLIVKAIENGYDKFGISEHLPLPKNKYRKPTVDEFNELVNIVSNLKKKYNKKIKIYMGVECEYFKDKKLDVWVKEIKNLKGVDYLNFGNHFYDSCYEKYKYYHHHTKKEIIDRYKLISKQAIESRLFIAYNHPDIFIRDVKDWDQDCIKLTKYIIQKAIKYDLALEFNLNGLALRYDLDSVLKELKIKKISDWQKIKEKKISDLLEDKILNKRNYYLYPFPDFWKLMKDTKVKINIGIDTHNMQLMNDHYYHLALHLLNEWGLKNNIVYDLEIKKPH